jgi:aminoglycoside 6'-N-acetyltransferase I
LIVRRAAAADLPVWAAMLARLHPDMTAAEWEAELATLIELPEPYVGFLAFTQVAEPIGMIDARVRNYAEGAPALRAPYVEDLWVMPEHRGRRVAKQLLQAVEQWARCEGHEWLGSDARLDNETSHAWHSAAGFEEVERLVVFGKPLGDLHRPAKRW